MRISHTVAAGSAALGLLLGGLAIAIAPAASASTASAQVPSVKFVPLCSMAECR